ncbi:DUF5906 domain-containing protein [Bengtsoniella intestinalis]|uniref:DNA primase family protein n=1 Tax=Bengtsoniella intestinalis TaxID=3073143 RepID=UPI00391F2FE3
MHFDEELKSILSNTGDTTITHDTFDSLPDLAGTCAIEELLYVLPAVDNQSFEDPICLQDGDMDPMLWLSYFPAGDPITVEDFNEPLLLPDGQDGTELLQALGITTNRSPSKYKPSPPVMQSKPGTKFTDADMVEFAKKCAIALQLMIYKEEAYQYTGTHWKQLSVHQLHVALRQYFSERGIDGTLVPQTYKSIDWLIRHAPEIQRDEPLPHHSHLLNFTDGTLNLYTGEFYPHMPEDYLLTCLDFAHADIPCASGETFEQFIACAGQGSELIRRQVLQMLIVALTGLQCKTFFAIIGPSGTGKTQLGRLIASLLGEDTVTSLCGMSSFKDKFALGNIRGKKVILCMDLDDTILPKAAVGMLKQLVGDDAIRIEPKYKDGITVYHKPIFICAGNHPIRLNNLAEEEALLKRMVIIPFMGTPVEEDRIPQLFEALTEERAYIVGQAILEYSRLMADGCQPIRAEVPDEYQAKDSRIGYDSVKSFLKACCLLKVDASITSEALYQHYCAYCEGEAIPLDKLEFARLFKSLILAEKLPVQHVKRVASGNRGYQGLTVRDDM